MDKCPPKARPDVSVILLTWDDIHPRLARVRLKGAVTNITIIAVYAPTLDAADDIKNDFYADLQDAVDETPASDILVVAGDWNARTGPADESTRHLLGRFALGNRCSNGERLVEFASANRLVVSSTRFQHRKRHLETWFSNDGRTRNQNQNQNLLV